MSAGKTRRATGALPMRKPRYGDAGDRAKVRAEENAARKSSSPPPFVLVARASGGGGESGPSLRLSYPTKGIAPPGNWAFVSALPFRTRCHGEEAHPAKQPPPSPPRSAAPLDQGHKEVLCESPLFPATVAKFSAEFRSCRRGDAVTVINAIGISSETGGAGSGRSSSVYMSIRTISIIGTALAVIAAVATSAAAASTPGVASAFIPVSTARAVFIVAVSTAWIPSHRRH